MAEAATVMSIALTWGTEPAERALAFPCDGHLRNASAGLVKLRVRHPPGRIVPHEALLHP